MKNHRLRMLSFIIAAFLWYFVSTNVSTVTIAVPLEVTGLPEGKIITSVLPNQAQVRISGPSFMVSKILSAPPALRKEIAATNKRRVTVQLAPSDLSLPSVVKVLSITPGEIEFKFENRVRKKVPVQVLKVGVLGPGLSLGSLEVRPAEVIIEGPESDVLGITEVSTYPIDLRDIHGDFKQEAVLRRPGPLIGVSEETVVVRAKINVAEIATPTAPPTDTAEGAKGPGRKRDVRR
jgi:YbbR domain-containing protein